MAPARRGGAGGTGAAIAATGSEMIRREGPSMLTPVMVRLRAPIGNPDLRQSASTATAQIAAILPGR